MDHLIGWGRDAVLLVGFAVVPVFGVWGVLVWWRGRTVPLSIAVRSAGLDVTVPLSLIGIAVFGLRPGIGLPGGFEQWNLVPFRDLARALDGRPWGLGAAATNVLGNAALFIPWGVAFALRFRNVSLPTFLLLTVVMAVGIEVWQAVTATGRSSDVTDMLMNAIGGVIGYGVGRLLAGRRHAAGTSE